MKNLKRFTNPDGSKGFHLDEDLLPINPIPKAHHTAGEWKLKDCTISSSNYDNTKGNIDVIAQCYSGFDMKGTLCEAQANAKLIVVAPKMLKALKILVNKYMPKSGRLGDIYSEPEFVRDNVKDEDLIMAIEIIKRATE